MLEKKRENEVRVETHIEVDKLKQRRETVSKISNLQKCREPEPI